SIAIANYAKQHPDKTFVDGSAGAQDTTLKVQAPNFFRFNGDGAQWNAGLGDVAYNKLGWRKAAIVSDDYSFGWTSTAGFIAEFCAAGGQVTKRIFPPLNTTDYSSYAQQMPTDVDGTFVAVGGAGLIPFLKAYEQAKGPIEAKKFIGNLFWGTPGQFEQLGPRVAGAYIGGAGTAGDLDTPAAQDYATNIIGKWFKVIPPGKDAASAAPSTFTYGYYLNAWGLVKGLEAVKGDIADQSKLQAALAKVELPAPYGTVKLDANRQAIFTVYDQQLYMKDGKLAVKTVSAIPNVDQTFGGTFSGSTPAPGRNFPGCEKKSLPWLGKSTPVKVVGG
ncbi:MAG TPA: ABC transporter substrate-binding protein, partial [Solirubrobacteraceae bacterium]|nr:ABC transporter substrate-binding protein [Solirubrobacteraceae bacterium]